MPTRSLLLATLCLLALTGCKFGSSSSSSSSSNPPDTSELPPNILFIVIDDVGVDQFASFGYGGAQPAQTASIDAIAQAGVRFRNTWSMPTCSPTAPPSSRGVTRSAAACATPSSPTTWPTPRSRPIP